MLQHRLNGWAIRGLEDQEEIERTQRRLCDVVHEVVYEKLKLKHSLDYLPQAPGCDAIRKWQEATLARFVQRTKEAMEAREREDPDLKIDWV